MKFKRKYTKERFVCEDETGAYRLYSVAIKFRLLWILWIPFMYYAVLIKE